MGYEQTSNSHGNAPAEQTRVGSHEVSWPGVCRYEGREGRSNATREAQQRRKTSLDLTKPRTTSACRVALAEFTDGGQKAAGLRNTGAGIMKHGLTAIVIWAMLVFSAFAGRYTTLIATQFAVVTIEQPTRPKQPQQPKPVSKSQTGISEAGMWPWGPSPARAIAVVCR